jgi:serine/threonine protein kinase
MPRQLKLTENFEIIGHLGRGGMAEVYKARQVSLDRVVAVKELKPAFLSSEEMVERFEREARTASRLTHENIAQVYQLGRTDRSMFIAMEFVDGVDLKTMIQRTGNVAPEIAVLIIHGAARALAFAHPRGLIHRDIKPGNIMVSRKGEVKLMDFGIVREIDSDLTHTGAFLGTPSYMSPEQFRGEKLTPSSDLFSLGVVFYESLTGQKPFRADDDTSLAKKVQTVREVAPRRVNPETPWRTQRVVRQLLAKKPERRFASAQDLVYRLEGLMRKEERSQGAEILAEYLESSNALVESEDATVRVDSKSSQVQIKKTGAKKAKAAQRPETEEPPPEVEAEISSPFKWLWRAVLILILILGAALSLTLLSHRKELVQLRDTVNRYYERVFKDKDQEIPARP